MISQPKQMEIGRWNKESHKIELKAKKMLIAEDEFLQEGDQLIHIH